MTHAIKDEFSNKRISRQRKYQLRRKKEGLCIICGTKPTEDGDDRCPGCKEDVREQNRLRMRKASKSKAWRPGKPGRPPKK